MLPALITALCFSACPCCGGPSQTARRPGAASSRTIDRVVASVDGTAITQSDVEAEYRTEVFLEECRVPSTTPDADTFARVLDRIIDQKLLLEEATAAGHKDFATSEGGVEQALAELRRKFVSAEAFQAALRSAEFTEQDLMARIEEQQTILRIVDQRIRPLVSVGHDEIESYYQKIFLPEWAKKSKESSPALADVEAQIQEILVQDKINQQLEVWLKELRATHRVRRINSIF